eukprot:1377930-Amorphochlora_amoeboformis.AAC.1
MEFKSRVSLRRETWAAQRMPSCTTLCLSDVYTPVLQHHCPRCELAYGSRLDAHDTPSALE